MQPIVSVLFTFILLCASVSKGECVDDYTSGFMSMDRMDDLLANEGDVVFGFLNTQGIFPEVNFTCSGSIQSWIFGARWLGNTDSFTELQIWRPDSEDGSYTKVGNTTIITEQSTTQLYEYQLSSPLAFQAGDVLGYYHPAISSSQLRLYCEQEGRGERQLGYYYDDRDSAASQLNINGPGDTRFTIFINVVTDPPGCGCGFMSVERMRLLLDLDNIGSLRYKERRQQITPDMRFTCDGMITKWIIGADLNNNGLYPELQVWRNVGNTTYQMINGTLIESPTQNSNRIYEYDNFSPIPVQAGDILGVFIPRTQDSRLLLLSESRNNPINYYLETGNTVSESPYDMFDIQNTFVMSQGYHPLVSVEISTYAVIPLLTTSTLKGAATEPPLSHTPTLTMTPQSTLPPQNNRGSGALALYISVGVICAVLTSAIIVVVVTVCLCRTRKNSMNISDNVAYGMSKNGMDMYDNPAYIPSTLRDKDKEVEVYDYVITTGGNDIISTSPNGIVTQ